MSEKEMKCAGCHWLEGAEPGHHCYMFAEAPIMLPCTQHDKFADTRDMLAAVYRKNPGLLSLALSGMIEELTATQPPHIPTDNLKSL